MDSLPSSSVLPTDTSHLNLPCDSAVLNDSITQIFPKTESTPDGTEAALESGRVSREEKAREEIQSPVIRVDEIGAKRSFHVTKTKSDHVGNETLNKKHRRCEIF